MKKLTSIILACLSLTLTAETTHKEYLETDYSWCCTHCNTTFNVHEIWFRVLRIDNFGNVYNVGKWFLKYITECPNCGRKPFWETGNVPKPEL